jgi:hypothetical protein
MTQRVVMLAAIAATTFLIAPVAFAQSFSDLSSTSVPPVTLSLSTPAPQPYSSDVLTVDSTTITLSNATLTVLVNGKNIYQGNVQPVTVSIGAAGASTIIEADVVSQGQSYTASIAVDPGDVSLVEEPIASTPPLYAGKPLVPLGGEVRLVAVAAFRTPSGTPINPSDLAYTWMQDDSTLESSSGIGKSAIIVDTPLQYRDGDYSVTVSTQDGTEVGAGSVTLTAEDPTVRIYEDDPLLGILFDHALGDSFSIAGPEASFYAASYSFSLADGAPTINWFLNGSAAGSDNAITLRPTGSGAGSASISVSGSEPDIYENASAGLTLSYGSNSNSSLFGL